MKNFFILFLGILMLVGCNPTTLHFSFIYNPEGPNREIAKRMKSLLESKYNVEIELIEGIGTEANLDSLVEGKIDMTLAENYIDYKEGLNSAFSVYSEVLHIFYKKELAGENFESLMNKGPIYIGKEHSPAYNLMMDMFDFYGVNPEELVITFDMSEAVVVVELTSLFTREHLRRYAEFRLFSFDEELPLGEASRVEGIALKYPRTSPFVIPKGAYWDFTQKPVVTLAVDLIMLVRSSMLEVSVNDLTSTMLRNRQIFTSIDPLLFGGLNEDFDQSILNIPLHEGARTFLDRDEPSFLERYAELGGVILSIIIAFWSGIVSLTKWQAQKKKDKIDEFYEDLIQIKNSIPALKTISEGVEKAKRVQADQNKAFEMLIAEKLVANDSFRIYMELSRETINDLRRKMRAIRARSVGATS